MTACALHAIVLICCTFYCVAAVYQERTDQFVFDVLHAQGSWSKIVAFSHENAFAKKRLISRTSRYSGLLDILEVRLCNMVMFHIQHSS
jgi:hypothetical protein